MADTIMQSRADFLAERKLGIGGSDISSLWNIGYGCRLRLWRDKRNEPPDYESVESGPMRLGKWLEPHIADEYEAKTGRRVIERGQIQHPEHPELRVHIDREVLAPEHPGPGVLEIKALGRAMFYKTKSDGLPEDYILQVQHGLVVTGFLWGAYAVMNRDNCDLMCWDVPRDEDVCAQILEQGPMFWATVENGPRPDPLEPDDRRCQSCEYRKSCWGGALMPLDTSGDMPQAPDLAVLLAEYAELDALYCHKLADNSRGTETDAQYEEVVAEIKARLADRQAVMVGDDKVYCRPQAGRVTVDTALLGAYELLLKKAEAAGITGFKAVDNYKKVGKPFRPLRIYLSK